MNLHDLSPKYQAQAAAQMHGKKPIAEIDLLAAGLAKKRPRIRQNAAGLNQTEQRFFDYLKAKLVPSGHDVGSQRIRLKLANGAWYKPDNDAQELGGGLTCYEVKGYMRPKDSLTLKVAAKEFPHARFVLVTERRDGGWDMQTILP